MGRTMWRGAGVALLSTCILMGVLRRTDSPTRPQIWIRPEKSPTSASGLQLPDQAQVEAGPVDQGFTRSDAGEATIQTTSEVSDADIDEAIFEGSVHLETANIVDANEFGWVFSRISRLQPASARRFIARFRSAHGPAVEIERKVAIELVVACGGQDAAEFVHLLLNDPTLAPKLRDTLLEHLSGLHGVMSSGDRLPIDDALASTALALCQSRIPLVREGGAGLLGCAMTAASREELQRLAEEDPDVEVRTVAVLSLRRIGDASTSAMLERLRSIEFPGRNGHRFREVIDSVVIALAYRLHEK